NASDALGANLPHEPGRTARFGGELAVLGVPRDAAAPGAGLRGRSAGGRDAEHAHRLQAEAELLAAVGGGDVEPGQVAYALEPIADRVSVREEALRGAGDVAVGVEERLE